MSKKIYCTQCKRKVMVYDGKTTMVIDGKCKNCNLLITYNPLTDKVTKKKMPMRNTSSGMRFY